MDESAWIATGSAVVALVALLYTARAANSARRQAAAVEDQTRVQREQTELQRELACQAAQPYVWADIVPDMQQGSLLQIVVGNSGPTVAKHVRVTFDPPLASEGQFAPRAAEAQDQLRRGLTSLSPGRVIRWPYGLGRQLLAEECEVPAHRVRVDAEGPHGPLPTLEIEINMSEWRQASDAPDGSMHHIRKAIQELNSTVKQLPSEWRKSSM